MKKESTSSTSLGRTTTPPVKTTYRVRNWRDYNAALGQRGSLTLWFDDELGERWINKNKTGKPGASLSFLDSAIEICLSLRVLFRLPLRQTEGFVKSLFSLAGLDLPVPDYSTMSRRQKDLTVSFPVRESEQARHIVIDSTGLKVFGEGEWKVKKHGAGKRRLWKKLHLSVDEATGEVLAAAMTDGDAADGPLLPELVTESIQNGGEVAQAGADGAYDSWDNDTYLTEIGVRSTIPPRKGSKIRQHGNCHACPLQRDENLRQIREKGRETWAKESGYTRRCLVETQMMRQKTILGGKLGARCEQNQAMECRLRCAILNRLTHLGMPDSYQICIS